MFGFHAQDTQIAQRRKVTVVRDQRIGPDCQCTRRLDRIRKLQFASGSQPGRTFGNFRIRVHDEP